MPTSPRPYSEKRFNDYGRDVNWVSYYNWFPRSIKWPLIKGHVDNHLATISLTFLFVKTKFSSIPNLVPYRNHRLLGYLGGDGLGIKYGSPLYATYIKQVSRLY